MAASARSSSPLRADLPVSCTCLLRVHPRPVRSGRDCKRVGLVPSGGRGGWAAPAERPVEPGLAAAVPGRAGPEQRGDVGLPELVTRSGEPAWSCSEAVTLSTSLMTGRTSPLNLIGATVRRVITTPWGDAHAIVEQSQDQTWYAVLRDRPEPGICLGGQGPSADLALAQLAAQCARVPRPRVPTA